MSHFSSILFVDAYDSFTRNIVALLYNCIPKVEIVVVHIDTNVQEAYGLDITTFVSSFGAVVLGPGPGDPRNEPDVGLFGDVLDVAAASHIPLLGICLGFQSLCLRYDYSITRLPLPSHGQIKEIKSFETDIFQGVKHDSGLWMGNYNSFAVPRSEFLPPEDRQSPVSTATSSTADSSTSSLTSLLAHQSDKTSQLQLLAWDDDGFAMAVRHEALPLWGLQFHPESCMSYGGGELIKNWWSQAVPYIGNRVVETLHHSKTDNSFHSPQPGPLLPSVQSPPTQAVKTTSMIQKVTWNMSKSKALDSQRLSKFCYEAAGKEACVMLESAAKGRHCIYAFPEIDAEIVEYANGKLILRHGQSVCSQESMSPQEALDHVQNRLKTRACNGGCPSTPFWGGWVGFCSYEMGLDLISVHNTRDRIVPDFSFLFVERSIVFDQRRGDICVQSIKDDDEAWLDSMRLQIQQLNKSATFDVAGYHLGTLREAFDSVRISTPDHDEYTDKIRACQEQLHAGNSYELCLTSEARVDMPALAGEASYCIYQNLIRHNPVPFAAYLHFPSSIPSSLQTDLPESGTTIMSTSPEQFLSWSRDGTLDMIPMKGTVQRTPHTTIDEVHRILGSRKETAENLMIADLIRHDLYGVVGCQPYPWTDKHDGSVEAKFAALCTMPRQEDNYERTTYDQLRNHPVPARDPISILDLNAIKEFDTVYQLVSHIRANPSPHIDVSNPRSVIAHNHPSLQHVFPPGSMTGAPKKRSCEILQQLEQRNRGVYSGIIGYMDVGGGGCWNVAIRTAFSSEAEDYVAEESAKSEGEDEDIAEIEKRKIWHVGAGGAVTVLSDVEGEWQEMMGKLNNVLKGFEKVKQEMPEWRPEMPR